MDDLFRFIAVRPAQSPDTARTVIISGNTPFQREVGSRFRPGQAPADRWQIVHEAAEQLVDSLQPITDVTSLASYPKYQEFDTRLQKPDPKRNLASVDNDVKAIFGKKAPDLATDPLFQKDGAQVWDSIVLIFLLPRLQRGPFAELVRVAQLMDIIRRVAAGDVTLDTAAAVDVALSATLVLPPDLFPSIPGRLQPVGHANLLVVKQHIEGYELGEIVQIENILRGESRKKTTKHTLSNERTITLETEKTTETTNDLQTSERFALKREAENTVKEDTSVKAGVNASYKYGDTVQVSTNVNVDYSNAKADSQKVSSDYAKDVVSRAISKVTERIRQQETTRVLETFEEDEEHGFQNDAQGAANVSGIYQWVNKIYRAQVFSYGWRLLFDVMVPEPAALLIEAANGQSTVQAPAQPPTFDLSPAQLTTNKNDPNYFGNFLTTFGVDGADAPPLDGITVSKTFAVNRDDKQFDNGAEITIDGGFIAKHVHVNVMYNYTDSSTNGIHIMVGNAFFGSFKQQPGQFDADLTLGEMKSIPIGVETFNVSDYTVTVEVSCEPSPGAIEQWRVKTHSKIVAAAHKMQSDYKDALAALKFEKAPQGPLGSNNPEDNRRIERTELKRAVIALVSENDLLGFSAITQDLIPQPPPVSPPQTFPRPDPKASQSVGNYARFFEQAFEWENMSYVFYPYYWGRKPVWYDRLLRTNDDALFGEFLRAGQARVVIPVRPSMEPALTYFLMTRQIWEGGDPPLVTDGDYLPIVQEIKENTGAPGDEVPYGDAWKVSVPTTLIKLRADDSLPTWALTPPWTWKSN